MSILSDVNPIAGDALFLLSKFRGVIFLPATKKEEIIFTCMMAFGMVLGMSSYNALWNLGWQGPWFQGGSARGLFHRQSLGFPAGPEILAPEKDVSHRHGDRYALVDGSHDDYADPFPVPPHHISPDPFPGLSPQLFVCLAAPAAPGRASGPFPFPPADSCRKVSERRL